MAKKLTPQQMSMFLSSMQKQKNIDNTSGIAPKKVPETKMDIEENIYRMLNYPNVKARKDASYLPDEEEVDNIRHASTGRYTNESLNNILKNPVLSTVLTNALGAGHEFSTLFTDPRWHDDAYKSWKQKPNMWDRAKTILGESGEDLYNNFVGSIIGATNMSPELKTQYIRDLSEQGKIPDGYGSDAPFRDNPNWSDPYKKNGLTAKTLQLLNKKK
jgi:hypothetical protein